MKPTLLLLVFSVVLIAPQADAIQVHHDLRIVLDPGQNQLSGSDTLTIRPVPTTGPILHLNQLATNVRIQVNGQEVPFNFNSGGLRPQVPDSSNAESLQLTVTYTVRFDDPVPIMPANADNPGYGVSGTITTKGTLLLDGAHWYPQIDSDRTTYRLRVEAPAGIIAVTAGRSLGHLTDSGRTVSNWEIDYPVRGLSLSAAHYQVREKRVGKLTAATYFFPENAHLSDQYLEATERYLRLYEDLFGPYPFQKFVVVENFFPTGFGFPSYTLLGSRVLQLPFIIDTSLGHEIAHCWWGNGVYVDYRQGNWSEGLTTYVADYFYKELKSPDAAREYRRQILRNYATLVNPQNDFPISRFQSRNSPLTKTIGYDKCAMVFHMLRQRLGEETFWSSLRDIYKDFLFKPVSWKQLREGFERRAGKDLENFFDQWIVRDGAPRMTLVDITTERKKGLWRTRGKLVQDTPYFDNEVEVQLISASENARHKVSMASSEAEAVFEFESIQPPTSLVVDPDVHIFRKLDPSEIPPAINTLKGADSVLVVLSSKIEKGLQPVVNTLVESLGLNNYRVISEKQAQSTALENSDLLLIGYSETAEYLLANVAGVRDIAFSEKDFVLKDRAYDDPTDSFFGVFAHPLTQDRTVALFLPLSSRYADVVARKITHYGKYSYLAFSGSRNRAKGVWPVRNSPLIHRFSFGN